MRPLRVFIMAGGVIVPSLGPRFQLGQHPQQTRSTNSSMRAPPMSTATRPALTFNVNLHKVKLGDAKHLGNVLYRSSQGVGGS